MPKLDYAYEDQSSFISGKTTIENEDIIEEFGTYNFLEISFVLKKLFYQI